MKPGDLPKTGVITPQSSTAEPLAPKATAPKPGEAGDRFMGVPLSREAQLRRLGVDPQTNASQILDVLGKSRFAEVQVVRVPGRIVWFNPDVARLLGFDVPPSNQLTPELEKQLLEALSFRVLKPGEEPPPGAEVITAYADKYGGNGLGGNKGAGRAAFLPARNVNIKGIGVTPLVTGKAGFDHSHGGAPMKEGFLEAIWGEVGTNLFAEGSTRILAVIDTGDHTVWSDGSKEKRALIVRAGDQIRPAHLLDPSAPRSEIAPMFVRSAAQSNDLVLRVDPGTKTEVPDLAGTMRRIVQNHARTAAEQFRWRVMHGALSHSNMELDGSQLDLGTIQTQPRTAKIRTLPHITDPDYFFGSEHKVRGRRLQEVYDTVRTSVSKADKKTLNATELNVAGLMADAYAAELSLQLLKATGLKEDVALRLHRTKPQLGAKLSKLLVEMSELRNEGSILADKDVVRDVAVLDVFNLLRELPKKYFDAATPGITAADVLELSRPIVRGTPAQEAKTNAAAKKLAAAFVPIYQSLIAAAQAIAPEHYAGTEALGRSMMARAGFENEPIDRLYRAELSELLSHAISGYEWHQDVATFREVVDKTISASVRNVDALLGQGGARKIEGGVELEQRTIDGIRHSVRVFDDGKRRLHLELPISGSAHGGWTLHDLPGKPHLADAQVNELRYKFTTNGWADSYEIGAKRGKNEDGQDVLTFDIPVLPSDVGRLEGLFHSTTYGDHWIKDGASNFRGYTFAVPDAQELGRIRERLGI